MVVGWMSPELAAKLAPGETDGMGTRIPSSEVVGERIKGVSQHLGKQPTHIVSFTSKNWEVGA
jgi:hypothetical protein